MRTTVAVGAVLAVLGMSLPAVAQFQLGKGGRGIYVSPQGGVNLGYGGGGYVSVGQSGNVRVALPARIQNRLANHYVQQPLPGFAYGAPGFYGPGYGAYPGYYPQQQPYYWYSYRYFPVANSSLFGPSSLYPYGYRYDPSSDYVDYYTPPYDLPGAGTGLPAGAGLPGGGAAPRGGVMPDTGAPAGVAPPAGAALPAGAMLPGAGWPADALRDAASGARAVKTSTPEARRRAALLAEAGDALFRKQRFQDALAQYRTATRIAPDLGDFFLRQGFAQIAARRYDEAAKMFKRAVELDPGLAAADLRVDTLYDDARLAKYAHLDALAAASLRNPDDADLLFVLATFLHFDGQADRARKFFARADALAAPHDGHIRPFLDGDRAVASTGDGRRT